MRVTHAFEHKVHVIRTLLRVLELSKAFIATGVGQTRNEAKVTAPRHFRKQKCNTGFRRKPETLIGAR